MFDETVLIGTEGTRRPELGWGEFQFELHLAMVGPVGVRFGHPYGLALPDWRSWGHSVRYQKMERLLKLAFEMQGRRSGISLAEIEEEMGVGRRTAQRMRDAILRTFPQADEVETGERTKRWTIP